MTKTPIAWTLALALGAAGGAAQAGAGDGWQALGKFDLASGRTRVSDPCHKKSAEPSPTSAVLLTKRGKWTAAVHRSNERDLGTRVSELMVLHEAVEPESLSWSDAGFIVGVDSGTAGVFDDQHFRDEAWYERLVVGMESEAQLVPFGAISRSGFGDGGYRCLVARGPDKKIVGIRLVFIGDGEEGEQLRATVRRVFQKY